MIKILVTGGAGHVGSCLARALVNDPNHFVVIVDDLSTGCMWKLPEEKYDNWKFIKCDVNQYRDIAEVMLSYQFDYVFHYAATVGVSRTLNHPVGVLDDIDGIRHILNLSKGTGVKRVFFSSSSEVYGEPVELPQNEDTTPLNSRLPYAIVKNVGEAFLKSYKQEFDLDYTIFRFFNTYGPFQSTDFVMSKFIKKALKNDDITIYGDGMQTRTFCYSDDNIDACMAAFKNDKCVNDVVNIGNDKETTILELASVIKDVVGSSSKIVHLSALKEGDMTRRQPDISKMHKLLNRELCPMHEGIERILESGNVEKW